MEPTGDGATLLTYGAVVDLGSSITHMLFAGRVRELALGTPGLVRRYVEGRRQPAPVARAR